MTRRNGDLDQALPARTSSDESLLVLPAATVDVEGEDAAAAEAVRRLRP